MHGPAVEVVDQPTGRREHLHRGDRVRFIRPHRADGRYVANGTAAQVLHADPDWGQVTIACNDGPTLTLQPASLTAAQPIRLDYAGHALRLQGGQAAVVLVLPGSWQTSRQSAYSMLTRCTEQVHVFLDNASQCTAPYRDSHPVRALADRWTQDATKFTASMHLDPIDHHDPLAQESEIGLNE